MLETNRSYLKCTLTNCVARIASPALCSCVRASLSHQPPARAPCTGRSTPSWGLASPSTTSVFVAPAENATDESDDDCHNEMHWPVSTPFCLVLGVTTHRGTGLRACGPACKTHSSTFHQPRSTIRRQGSSPHIHSKSAPHQLSAQAVRLVAQGRCRIVSFKKSSLPGT